MGTSSKNTLEVIGDSAQFSEQGSNYVRAILRKYFAGEHLIEYGFTGYRKENTLDTNSFINEYMDENPDQAYRVLANIVGHTHVALNEWGTAGSALIRNFVVVYTNDGMQEEPAYNLEGIKISGFTTFGDDIIMSDYILQAQDGDRIVCVEGGVQSFRQVVNALSINVPVDFIYNVRTTNGESFFSTARFLNKICEGFVGDLPPSKEWVQSAYDDYIKSLKNVWSTSKPDYLTKKALFEEAVHIFIDKEFYKCLKSLCTFTNALQ